MVGVTGLAALRAAVAPLRGARWNQLAGSIYPPCTRKKNRLPLTGEGGDLFPSLVGVTGLAALRAAVAPLRDARWNQLAGSIYPSCTRKKNRLPLTGEGDDFFFRDWSG